MEIVVRSLGRTAKAVGDNLERLAKELLARQGFGSFVRNARKTGAEIDLRGVHRVTGQPLITECKARGKPIDTHPVKLFYAEWQKERGPSPRIFGSILSLSGFSGTARQWHSELSAETRQDFAILDGPDLLRQLEDVSLILSASAVAQIVTERYGISAPTVQWLTYSEHGFAWILRHPLEGAKDILTIAGPEGRPLPTWKVNEIYSLVRRHFRSAEMFGLATREGVQLALLDRENRMPADLANAANESPHDIGTTVAMLIREGRLAAGPSGELSFRRDVVQFVNTAREFLDLEKGPALAGSSFASEILASPQFMSYLEGRYKLGMKPEEQRVLTGLLRMSPSALQHALFADEVSYTRTREHIDEIVKDASERDRWLSAHRTRLLRECVFRALHDLTAGDKASAALLGRLGIKRVRLAAELIALGTTWDTVVAKAESTTLIAVAGGPIPAGSLVSSTNPGGEFLWDGLLSVHLQDPDGAERSFSLALEDSLKSGDADVTEAALNNIALIKMSRGDWGQAIKVLEQLFSLREPAKPASYLNMIRCLMESGEGDKAGKIVSSALERFPELVNSEIVVRFSSGWDRSPDALGPDTAS